VHGAESVAGSSCFWTQFIAEGREPDTYVSELLALSRATNEAWAIGKGQPGTKRAWGERKDSNDVIETVRVSWLVLLLHIQIDLDTFVQVIYNLWAVRLTEAQNKPPPVDYRCDADVAWRLCCLDRSQLTFDSYVNRWVLYFSDFYQRIPFMYTAVKNPLSLVHLRAPVSLASPLTYQSNSIFRCTVLRAFRIYIIWHSYEVVQLRYLAMDFADPIFR
jgi:hypothetical protein